MITLLNEFWSVIILLAVQLIAYFTYLFSKKLLNKSRFLRFLGILSIGVISSLNPFGPISLIFGFPAVLTSSILVSLFLDKDLKWKTIIVSDADYEKMQKELDNPSKPNEKLKQAFRKHSEKYPDSKL